MQAAASMAVSAEVLATGLVLASGAAPVPTLTYPPAPMMRPRALRSTTRSLMTGKASARHGSIDSSSPSRTAMTAYFPTDDRYRPGARRSCVNIRPPSMMI